MTDFDDGLGRLVADMFASMEAAGGVGLAANQIGVLLQVFVYDCPDGSGGRRRGVVVNPTLHLASIAATDSEPEGCLSIAGQHAELARAATATVTGVDLVGRPIQVAGTGLLARCLQHEADHLRGVLFVDLLSRRERARILDAHAQAHSS